MTRQLFFLVFSFLNISRSMKLMSQMNFSSLQWLFGAITEGRIKKIEFQPPAWMKLISQTPLSSNNFEVTFSTSSPFANVPRHHGGRASPKIMKSETISGTTINNELIKHLPTIRTQAGMC